MTAAIAQLYRYPIKGLSAEPLEHVSLAVGQCLPQDRRFAIALGSTAFDPAHPQWLAKTHFIMLMRDEQLARLSTSFDPASSLLTIAEKDRVLLSQSLSDPEGRRTGKRQRTQPEPQLFSDPRGPSTHRPAHP